ncbi:MAG: hypothetical protein SWY16_00965 [Cyanobacteriota bacterium]|nr:hypothetical protein [Cyanobacteriota bacterium]
MDDRDRRDLTVLDTELQEISTRVRSLADRFPEDAYRILSLLRALESLHRDICDDYFQPALPQNRQALYNLLREIEAEGGWPYIPRMKLRSFLKQLLEEEENRDRP